MTGPGVFDSVADAIGNTPLVRLNRVTDGIAATVYLKLADHLGPPLPVAGAGEPIARAAERLSAHLGPVLLARNGYAVGLIDAEVLRQSVELGGI